MTWEEARECRAALRVALNLVVLDPKGGVALGAIDVRLTLVTFEETGRAVLLSVLAFRIRSLAALNSLTAAPCLFAADFGPLVDATGAKMLLVTV